MCGIAGMVGPAGTAANPDDLHRMCRVLTHRGPDDEGVYTHESVGLGMRRLSIIDVAGGHQPIHNEDKTVWVVCNGEIYNYAELRRELEQRGHTFYTHSDVEVIVHLYEERGADCVKKLRGMFAVALYDQRSETLLLIRDRLGKKPLYYAQHRGRLLFGSEIKAILAVAPQLAEISTEGLLQYLYFGYIPGTLSAFKAIHKLAPGHCAEYRAGAISVRRYWELPAYGTRVVAGEEELLNELERRLSEAVRIRLVSDVPLGLLLSGGVDSSIVAALMARESSSPIKTFSIGFRAGQFNESHHARVVAERFGTEHHEFIVEPDLHEPLAYLTRMMEEPFGDSSMLPTYYVCRMARHEVTVALGGDGGDELFAGYDRYEVARGRAESSVIPEWVGSAYREHVHPRLPDSVMGKNRMWNATLGARDRYLDDISYLPVLGRERSLLADDFLDRAGQCDDPYTSWRRLWDEAPAQDSLSRMICLDTETYLPDDILTKVDRMSMAASLEVRAPLLDHELVEWVTSLPAEWKLRGGVRKYLLKKLAERLGVPHAQLHRPKQGFQLPLVDWMRDESRDQFLQVLLDPRTLQRGYFKPAAVKSLVEEHVRGRRNRSGMLWRMLVLELWHRNFLERPQEWNEPPQPPRIVFHQTQVLNRAESTAQESRT